MGATRNTGYIENLIAYDGSDNIGIGGAVNVLYKVTMGGNTLISGNLNVTGTITFSSNVTANSFVKNGGVATEFLKADGTVDSSTYATVSYVDTSISNLIDAAPSALNTLNELAAALGDDSSFSTTVTTALGNRLRIDTDAQGLTSEQKANGRTNLGVVIGTDVQAYDADLGAIAALTGTNGLLKKTAANTWTLDTGSYLDASTSSTQNGYFGNIYLYDDSTPSHYLAITNSANLTAARTLSINVNDVDRTISLSGNLTVSAAATISGTNTGDQDLSGYQPLLTNPVTGTGSSNRIAYWNSVNSIAALDTASYPSLTELSYVKGVTSAIQTQINAITANYVTTNTIQEITVVKTFKSDDAAGLHFKNAAGTFVGALSTYKQWFSGGTSTDLALGAKANLYLFSNDGSNWAVKIDTNRDAIFASKVKIDGGTSSQFLKANGDLDTNTYLTANFDTTGTLRARTAKTTYRDNSANPSTDAPIRSLTNTEDNWIYLDSASTEWGIYHRNIDSNLVVAGQQTLKGNSIAFIGGNNLQAYICLSDGEIFAKSFNTSGSVTIGGNTALHAGNYNTYALHRDTDSEQTIGGRIHYWNVGSNRMNTDPRWNESGYDADLGALHIWATTAAGASYGRAGIALYNGTDYQYLTTKASTSGMFVNNNAIIHAGNIGSQSVNYANYSGYSRRIISEYQEWDFGTGSHSTNPMSISIYDNYTQAGAPTSYGTLVDIYGLSGHQHDQLYFAQGNLKHRYGWYGNNNWSGWNEIITANNISSYAIPYGNWTSSSGLNDNRLYLRTNGDTNHYLWNAGDDWEELVYYTGTGFRIQGSTGTTSAQFSDSGMSTSRSINMQTYNQPILLNASGTSSSGAAFGFQQVTGEGWTGIFVDFEPYTGWGLYHDNPNNYFCVTSEGTTGQLRSFTVPSRSSGNRTAYEKIRFDQNNGSILAGGDITAFSDGRVKTDIKLIENAVEKVKAIRGVTFLRKDSIDEYKDKRHAGVIAQDILEVLPEVVNKDNDTGMYNVAYGNLTALLIEAIKEQQNQIEELKSQIKNK